MRESADVDWWWWLLLALIIVFLATLVALAVLLFFCRSRRSNNSAVDEVVPFKGAVLPESDDDERPAPASNAPAEGPLPPKPVPAEDRPASGVISSEKGPSAESGETPAAGNEEVADIVVPTVVVRVAVGQVAPPLPLAAAVVAVAVAGDPPPTSVAEQALVAPEMKAEARVASVRVQAQSLETQAARAASARSVQALPTRALGHKRFELNHREEASRLLKMALEGGSLATLQTAIARAKMAGIPKEELWFAEVCRRRRMAVYKLALLLGEPTGPTLPPQFQHLLAKKASEMRELLKRAELDPAAVRIELHAPPAAASTARGVETAAPAAHAMY